MHYNWPGSDHRCDKQERSHLCMIGSWSVWLGGLDAYGTSIAPGLPPKLMPHPILILIYGCGLGSGMPALVSKQLLMTFVPNTCSLMDSHLVYYAEFCIGDCTFARGDPETMGTRP